MNMKKSVVLLTLLALLAAGGWWGAQRLAARTAPSYRTAQVRSGELVTTVSSTGTLTPVVNVQVGTPVSGIVKALYADYNSPVKTGQPIAQIDPAIFTAQSEQAKGAYLAAKANVDKARASEEDALRARERYARLVRDGLVARSDYDTADTAWKTARAARLAAEAAVTQARGSFDQARTNLEYATIRSPVDGIVISRNVDVGQTVAASLQTPTLFVIAQDLTRMQIDASVDEADVSRVREDATATFTVDAYPEARFAARVTQVRNSPVTVQNVVTYVVVLEVDNKDMRLKPGMTASVTFEVERRQCGLIVPNAALRFRPRSDPSGPEPGSGRGVEDGQAGQQDGAKRVYVLTQDGKARPVRVSTGIGNDRDTELVTDKLKPGDAVIVEQPGGKKNGAASAHGGPGLGPRF